MTYYDLYPKDQRANIFVLYYEVGGDGPLKLRARYNDSACPRCGKVDEYNALFTHGVDSDVAIRARSDVVGTTDDIFICFSARAQRVVADNRIKGLRFFELPDRRYAIAVPTSVAQVDAAGVKARKEVECLGRCTRCKRFRETAGGIWLRSITPPTDPLEVFVLDFASESGLGCRTSFIVSEAVAKIFRREKLSGIYYSRYEG